MHSKMAGIRILLHWGNALLGVQLFYFTLPWLPALRPHNSQGAVSRITGLLLSIVQERPEIDYCWKVEHVISITYALRNQDNMYWKQPSQAYHWHHGNYMAPQYCRWPVWATVTCLWKMKRNLGSSNFLFIWLIDFPSRDLSMLCRQSHPTSTLFMKRIDKLVWGVCMRPTTPRSTTPLTLFLLCGQAQCWIKYAVHMVPSAHKSQQPWYEAFDNPNFPITADFRSQTSSN